MNEWNPIETAPKDGTLIKIRQGRWQPVHARWRNGRWSIVEFFGPSKPTHWMLLQETTL